MQLGMAMADGTGHWSFTTPILSDGAHSLTATATDAAGNTGTAQVGLTLDTVAPTPAVISHATSVTGRPLAAGDVVTFTVTPTEAVTVGTAPGGPALTLNDGGTATYDAASSTGTSLVFRYTAGQGDSISDLHVTDLALNGATVTDAAGNPLDASGLAQLVGSDTGLMAGSGAPTVTAALLHDTGASATDSVTSDPTIAGTGDAGGTITVEEGGRALGTAPVDGTHVLTASETDAAGNAGATSRAFTLDTAPPRSRRPR